MKHIKNYNGQYENLSDEVYEILRGKEYDFDGMDDYKTGSKVRLISGVYGSEIAGYHFTGGWVTVCSVNVKIAEYIGFPKKDLKLVC